MCSIVVEGCCRICLTSNCLIRTKSLNGGAREENIDDPGTSAREPQVQTGLVQFASHIASGEYQAFGRRQGMAGRRLCL
jgi:hypothetical protein